MKKALATFNIYRGDTLEQLEQLRQRWHPAGELEDVLTTLILRSEALELAAPSIDRAVIEQFPELAGQLEAEASAGETLSPSLASGAELYADLPDPVARNVELGSDGKLYGDPPADPSAALERQIAEEFEPESVEQPIATIYAADEAEARAKMEAQFRDTRLEATGGIVGNAASDGPTLYQFNVYGVAVDPDEPEHTGDDGPPDVGPHAGAVIREELGSENDEP